VYATRSGCRKIKIKPSALGVILRGMVGPAPLPEKPREESAWEDDGGALYIRDEGYEQMIGPMVDA